MDSFLLKEFPLGCCPDATLILTMVLLEYGFKDNIYYSKDLDYEIPSHNANKLDNARKTLEGLFYEHPYAPEIEIKLLPKPNDFALGQHRYFYY